MIDFMLFDLETRRLLPNLKTVSTWQLMDLNSRDPETGKDFGVVLGHYTPPEAFYVDADFEVRSIGDGGPLDPGVLP